MDNSKEEYLDDEFDESEEEFYELENFDENLDPDDFLIDLEFDLEDENFNSDGILIYPDD